MRTSTHPFTYVHVHLINTNLSSCRLVALSTCRPSTIVNNKYPVRVRVRLGLGLGLVCAKG